MGIPSGSMPDWQVLSNCFRLTSLGHYFLGWVLDNASSEAGLTDNS
jgi:hypothetical protein